MMTLKYVPFVRVKAEKFGREDQVTGRRDGEEFGDAFNDAEDDCDQQ